MEAHAVLMVQEQSSLELLQGERLKIELEDERFLSAVG